MMCRNFNKGFTLLEVMVACLLMGMLVSALTMVFNQSSIAWRTGMAGVVNLADTRNDLGKKHDNYDNILPGLTDKELTHADNDNKDMKHRAVSLWKNGQLRTDRAFAAATESLSYADAKNAKPQKVASASDGQAVSLFTVGVRSYGPDGRLGTADDITTYPEEL